MSDDKGYIEATIEEWVRRNVAFPDKEKLGRCTKVVLRHLTVNKEPQGDVGVFAIKPDDDGEVEGLLRKIADAAQADADDLKAGVQLYALYAEYELDRKYVPRKVFRVTHADVEIERDVKPSEPPTEAGLVSQTMRHLEVVLRNQTIAIGQQLSTQQREMERLATMNEKFMERQIDMMVLVQDTLDNSHSRRLKEKEAETGIAMKETALAALAPLVPVLVNRIAGAQIMPEDNKTLMMLSGFLDNLTDEQQSVLLGSLTDSQRAVLAEIFHTYEKNKLQYLEKQKSLIQKLRPTALNSLSPQGPETPATPAVPVPLPSTISVAERLQLTDAGSSDPKIKQLEADAKKFVDSFKDMLSPKQPTPEKEEPK